MRRLFIIVALLILIPIAEIGVLIAVGKQIGVGWTLALMLATSALGGWLLRREGGRAWRAFQADINAGRPPGPTATDGFLVLLGGVFMLVPGFVSDVIGAVLILPLTRRPLGVLVQSMVARRLSPQVSTGLFGPRRVRVRTGTPRPPQGPQPPPDNPSQAIEGEIV